MLRGMLYNASNGEEDNLLGIHLDGRPGESAFVAEWAAEVIGSKRAQVTVRYFTADAPMEPESMIEELSGFIGSFLHLEVEVHEQEGHL